MWQKKASNGMMNEMCSKLASELDELYMHVHYKVGVETM